MQAVQKSGSLVCKSAQVPLKNRTVVLKGVRSNKRVWVKKKRLQTTIGTCRGSRMRMRTRSGLDGRRGSESRKCNWANIYTAAGSGSGRRAGPISRCRPPSDDGSASRRPPPERLSESGELAAVWPERGLRFPWAEVRFVSGFSWPVPVTHF